jgi:peptidoglycan/LPS O-acetylase OafA/YrhL
MRLRVAVEQEQPRSFSTNPQADRRFVEIEVVEFEAFEHAHSLRRVPLGLRLSLIVHQRKPMIVNTHKADLINGLPVIMHHSTRQFSEMRTATADVGPLTPKDVSRGRHLDGLRGIAALIVVFGHSSNANMHVVPGLNLQATAKTGVWLFFVLSAYLLVNSLVRAIATDGVSKALPAYAIRRAFRIIPLYYFVIGVLWALGAMLGEEALRHVAFVEGKGNFWTIPVEMTFYVLLVPIALVLSVFQAQTQLIACGILLIGFVAYWAFDPTAIYDNGIWVGNYLSFFAVGIAVAQLKPSGHKRFTFGLAALGCIAIIFFLPPVIAQASGSSISEGVAYAWVIGLGWGVVLYAVISNSVLRKMMSSRALVFAGKVSFGLYLTHIFVLPRVAEADWIPSPFKGALMVAMSLLVATACYYLLERHMIAAGAQLIKRLGLAGSAGEPIRQASPPPESPARVSPAL